MTTKRGSIVNHGILRTGDTTPVVDETLTGGGTLTKTFTINSDTVVFGLYIRSINGSVGVKVFTSDGVDSERRLVLDMGVRNLPTREYIIERSQLCLGMIRVVITYTNTCNLRLTAKPSFNKDGDAKEEAKDKEALALLEEERLWRDGMLVSNEKVIELLEAVRNHLRQITSIENNEGDKF
jgi:hypothetical protein